MLFVRLVLLMLLTSTFLTPAVSQQRDQKSKKSSKTPSGMSREAEELRLSAVSLLHSLSQSANEIDDGSERVRVLAEIGDAFWPVDREYARTVLLRSFKEIDKLPAAVGSDVEGLATIKRSLRRLVLTRIAKREPALANELVHDLPSDVPTADEKAMKLHGMPTPNAEALLAIAENLIQTDAKRATTIAAYSLQDGLSQRLRLFLIRLRAKDAAAADGLVAAALTEAASQHPGRLFDVLVLWDYAYQPQDFYFNGISWNRENNQPRTNTSTELKRMILSFAVTAIVENLQQIPAGGSAQDQNQLQAQLGALHSVIQQLLPSMQADWPRGSADLQQALARVEQELLTAGQSPPTRPPSEDPDAQKTAIEKLIERAAEASQGDARDNLYLAAAVKLFQLRQFERGKEVAAKIDNQEKRTMILEPLNFRLSLELVERKSLQEAWNTANQIKTNELRIAALARTGRAFTESGDSQSGLQALNTAQSLVSKADPSIELTAATLRIAAAFSKTEPARVVEVTTLAIQVMNKVKQDDTPWIVMSAAGAEDALNLSWRNVPGGGGISSIQAGFPRNGGLADVLSKLDFNQAISLAKSVNRKPLSLLAQASVCRAAIESTEGKTTARSN